MVEDHRNGHPFRQRWSSQSNGLPAPGFSKSSPAGAEIQNRERLRQYQAYLQTVRRVALRGNDRLKQT